MIKKQQISKNILLFFATILSIIIFIIIYELISYLKYQSGSSVNSIKTKNILEKSSVNNIANNKNKLSKHGAYIECLEKNGIMSNCDNPNNVQKSISKPTRIEPKVEKNSDYELFKDLESSNVIIKIIYLFLILSILQQIYLFLLVKAKYVLNIFDFHKSEWAINTSPMFGLLGTFFSIAIVLNSNNENIDTILINNFFDAVMTTIIGIIFYIINFYLKVFIYPNIVTEKRND